MKAIARQLSLLLASMAGWYLLAIAASYVLYPEKGGDAVDTAAADQTIYQSPPRYVVWELPKVAALPGKNVFLIGSSNVRDGFRPDDLKQMLPGYRVHNLGMGSSNITQSMDVIELIRLLPGPVVRDSVFVLGIWYGLFADDLKQWEGAGSMVVTEEVRYGLYRMEDGRPKPNFNAPCLPYIALALRPHLLLQAPLLSIYSLVDEVMAFGHKLLRERKLDFSVFAREKSFNTIDESFRQGAIQGWQNYMGTGDGLLKKEQFEKLLDLGKSANANGARLIIADLPLPEWHRKASSYYADYRKKAPFYIKELLKYDNVRYLDMRRCVQDEDFRDSAHPNPTGSKKMCRALGNFI